MFFLIFFPIVRIALTKKLGVVLKLGFPQLLIDIVLLVLRATDISLYEAKTSRLSILKGRKQYLPPSTASINFLDHNIHLIILNARTGCKLKFVVFLYLHKWDTGVDYFTSNAYWMILTFETIFENGVAVVASQSANWAAWL